MKYCMMRAIILRCRVKRIELSPTIQNIVLAMNQNACHAYQAFDNA